METSTEPFHYRPIYKPNQIICGSGQTVVVTGWSLKETIAKRLESDEYAGIGHLYSATRGINLLIRNVLANPHVRFLVIVNATREDKNAGGCECLADFFRYGFEPGISPAGRTCWVIRSSFPGYIDLEIDRDRLEQLRHPEVIEWQEVQSIAQAIEQVKAYARQGVVGFDRPAQTFDFLETASAILPGSRYGHRLEGQTIAETWVKIIHRIRTTGTILPNQYDGQWQELIDLVAVVQAEPEDFYFPEPNYLPISRHFLDRYFHEVLDAPTPSNQPVQREEIQYTYGQRLRSWFELDQIDLSIQKLIRKPHSARVVMSLWDVKQDSQEMHNPPCLNHIWLRIVENELSLTATFRSNDMFSAWPANAMGLRKLQKHIRDEIAAHSDYNLTLGPLITVSQSAHIYDDCWDNADKLIQAEYAKVLQQRDYSDPSGSFVITIQQGQQQPQVVPQIVVEQMTPGSGEVVNCYSGKSAQQLYRQIAATCPALETEHALYLGAELQKAEMAIAIGQPHAYQQDRPLSLGFA